MADATRSNRSFLSWFQMWAGAGLGGRGGGAGRYLIEVAVVKQK